MNDKATTDLLELVSLYMHEKTLFLTRLTENDIQIIKILDYSSGATIKEGQTLGLTESY
ncbi:hypothetical protein RJD24_02670 [Bacillaceae bacterium IKA-2]|nr:hypothetical protein RJD24_02670 [Bacillaceae bacterium IKA-2]